MKYTVPNLVAEQYNFNGVKVHKLRIADVMSSKMKSAIIYLVAGINSFITPEARIAGGNEVEPFKYNWLVRIVKNGEHACSGILLSDSALLTASHCSKESRFNYEVEVHRHNLELTTEEEHSQVIKVKSIDRHEKYDVAVWGLSKPIKGFNSTIELDRGNDDDLVESDKVLTMGWGWARSGGPFSSTLQEVELPIFNTATCGLTWLLRDRVVESGIHYCAGGEGGKDACVGDSGGPLLVSRGNRTILVGITSFGQPCAQRNFPSVWTRVSPFIQFIATAQQ